MKKLFLCLIILVGGCSSLNHQLFEMAVASMASLQIQAPVVQTKKITGVIGTTYNPEASQCDGSPLMTADGSKINPAKINQLRWVALSCDLIGDEYRNKNYPRAGHWKGDIHFGDTITIVSDNKELCGEWIVHDTMNKRFKNRVDFLQDRATGFGGKWDNITIIVKS